MNNTNGSLMEKAVRIAVSAHEGQKRKDGPAYIIHPIMVAHMLTRHGFSDSVVAAGLVHDVLEDTEFGEANLRAELGDDVVDMVLAVSYDKSLSWEDARLKYVESIRNASEGVKAISIADKIHNAESLLMAHVKSGPDIWKQFNRGKDKKMWFEEAMLGMVQETWKHPLVDEYALLVEKMRNLS